MNNMDYTVSFRTTRGTWEIFKSLCSFEGKTLTDKLNDLVIDYNDEKGSKILKNSGRKFGSQGRKA
jgi:hypothetical protein